jgi:hypothetical protein
MASLDVNTLGRIIVSITRRSFIENMADDHGRIANIQRSIVVTLTMLNSLG